jgi:hypothetical protein
MSARAVIIGLTIAGATPNESTLPPCLRSPSDSATALSCWKVLARPSSERNPALRTRYPELPNATILERLGTVHQGKPCIDPVLHVHLRPGRPGPRRPAPPATGAAASGRPRSWSVSGVYDASGRPAIFTSAAGLLRASQLEQNIYTRIIALCRIPDYAAPQRDRPQWGVRTGAACRHNQSASRKASSLSLGR